MTPPCVNKRHRFGPKTKFNSNQLDQTCVFCGIIREMTIPLNTTRARIGARPRPTNIKYRYHPNNNTDDTSYRWCNRCGEWHKTPHVPLRADAHLLPSRPGRVR